MLTPIQAVDAEDNLVGVVISKLEPHRGGPLRGYIAMLAVREENRGKGIATKLVRMAIDAMIERDADEVCSLAIFQPNFEGALLLGICTDMLIVKGCTGDGESNRHEAL